MVAIAPLHRNRHFMPELIVTHAEELAYLWGRRRAAVSSDSLTLRDLQHLHERIDAHLQGMLVAVAELPALLGDWLASTDRDEVFAIACALLRGGDAAHAATVAAAFGSASGARLLGLRDALGAAPQIHTETALHAALNGDDDARAAAAAAALAGQRRIGAGEPALLRLLQAEDPAVAEQAWRTLALLDGAGMPQPPYRDAVRRPQPGLRRVVLAAASWRGEAWVPQVARQLAEGGDAVGLEHWAAVGDTALQAPWTNLLAATPAPSRCALLARSGHPDAIEALLALMAEPDPAAAAAAGTAFTRLTGLDVEGERRTLPVNADADDFEREFAPDVWLPDAARAQQLWNRHHAQWRGGRRWCRGHEVSATLSTAAQASIDLAARWDFGMRAALAGARLMAPPPVV